MMPFHFSRYVYTPKPSRPKLSSELARLDSAAMAETELGPSTPPCLHLISACLSMEPTDCLISLARKCGGGSITESVQNFIWEHCLNQQIRRCNGPSDSYMKNFLKKVITEVESSGDEVLDELYERFAYYITSLKDDTFTKNITRVCKIISFIFPDGCSKLPSCPKSMILEVPLRCSLNMLEGDTGCSIWSSSLFLAEFILSYPELFSSKSCFEVGSGVGLVGIALAFVKASKVILSDGDMATLANLKLNLELNHLTAEIETPQGKDQSPILVECRHLPWESASENELRRISPDIVLGADVIYDPICLPHLIRVLVYLLNPKKLRPCQSKDIANGCLHSPVVDSNEDSFESVGETAEGAVAYFATVIRNKGTFNCFLKLACEAHLSVMDITERQKPLNLLPYMWSYDRSSIRLFTVKFMSIEACTL